MSYPPRAPCPVRPIEPSEPPTASRRLPDPQPRIDYQTRAVSELEEIRVESPAVKVLGDSPSLRPARETKAE